MFHDQVAARLTRAARAMLIEHVDGERFVEVPVNTGTGNATRRILCNLGLIRPNRRERAITTIITEDGRLVLCHLLAEYAEMLLRAGYGISGKSAVSKVAEQLVERLPRESTEPVGGSAEPAPVS